jgi:hypothetical protein
VWDFTTFSWTRDCSVMAWDCAHISSAQYKYTQLSLGEDAFGKITLEYAKRKSTITLKSLHHEIEPKVHRADIEVLKCELKPKVEFVLTVELTQQQHDAYAGALLGPNGDLAKIIQHQTLFLAWSARTVDCASKLFSQYEEPSQNQESELSRGRPWSGHAHNEDADIGEANEDLPFNTLVNIRRR